jgi:isocitrate dehydrogenase
LAIDAHDQADDQVTVDAGNAIAEHGVGVKCATITLGEARVREVNLKRMCCRLNGTLRNLVGGYDLLQVNHLQSVPRLVPHRTRRS